MSTTHKQTHGYGLFLLVSMAGAFVTALVHVVVMQLSLPPTDGAYGQSIFSSLSDPFVLSIGGSVALVSGLVVSPVLYFCLRQRRLTVALPMVFISVLATVVLLTPFSALLGWFTSYGALVISCLVYARYPDSRPSPATPPIL